MIEIMNREPVGLHPGDTIKVINAEFGATGANGKLAIYLGTYNKVDIPDYMITNGLDTNNISDVIVKLENNEYWNIGKDVKIEVIKNIYKCKEEKDEIIVKNCRGNLFIKDFEISKSGRGVKVNFTDGTYKKTYALECDEFDLRRALFIAIAKKLEGHFKYKDIEKVADAISITKKYIHDVDDAIKRYEEKEESKRIIASRKAKKIAYKERREARVKEELIEIQKEAYLRAMREANK